MVLFIKSVWSRGDLGCCGRERGSDLSFGGRGEIYPESEEEASAEDESRPKRTRQRFPGDHIRATSKWVLKIEYPNVEDGKRLRGPSISPRLTVV